MNNKELLQQQLNAIAQRRRVRADAIDISKSTGIAYNAALQRMVKMIKADIDAELLPVIKSTASEYTRDASYFDRISAVIDRIRLKWSSDVFKALADQVATQFIRNANTVNRERFNRSMKSVGMDVYGDSPELATYLDVAVSDNVLLIKSIPSQYLDQVQSIVAANMRAGNRPSAIVSALVNQFGITQRRAAFIARDQTAKANADLAERRQRNVGFDYFQWLDSDDERVRQRHKELAEKVTEYGLGIYRWDDPPLSDNGEPITPGRDFGCRCTARPVSNAEVEENKKAGKTRPGVKR